MTYASHYYKCSLEYLNSISPNIEKEIKQVLDELVAKNDPKNLTNDLFLILPSHGWSHSGTPTESNDPNLCRTSSGPELETKSDFAKIFDDQLIQLEIQSGQLYDIASDVAKFKIAFAEKRIQAGIEIIIGIDPANAIDMLVKLDVDCPVWVICLK